MALVGAEKFSEFYITLGPIGYIRAIDSSGSGSIMEVKWDCHLPLKSLVVTRVVIGCHQTIGFHQCHSPTLYQIQSAIAKLLVSFRCQDRSKSGKVKPGRQCGATVGLGDDVDVSWCRSRTGIGYLKEFCFQFSEGL